MSSVGLSLSPLEEVGLQVSTRLSFTLPRPAPDASGAREIETLLNQTVLRGGKRFRPMFLLLFGRLLGLDTERLAPYARAVELAHAATLAHDDVIDEAAERRSHRTLNHFTSNPHAILAGDFLLARVIAEISCLGEIAIIQDMARVLEQLVSGEWRQLEARGVLDVDRKHLERVAELKTASLISWCCTTPARLCRGSASLVALAQDFGVQVGIAFQEMDDLLDFEEGTGKPVAKDFQEGLINFVAVELLKRHPERRPIFAQELGKARESDWPWTKAELAEALESVRTQARARLQRAESLLNAIAHQAAVEGISVSSEVLESLLDVLSEVASRKQ